jgi:hypothetical protein
MVFLRLASALIAGVAAMAAGEIVRLKQQPGGQWSMLAATACVFAVGGAGLGLWMTFAPQGWWERIRRFALTDIRERLARVATPAAPRIGAAIALVGCGAYLILLSVYVPQQVAPWGNDQEAYLVVAQEIRDSGGISALVGQLLRGEFAEANRHPLYLALLSLRPTYEAGKLLSAGIGIATVVISTLLVGRVMGGLTAGVFCVLLTTNAAFCNVTSLVACEGLLILLCGLIWLACTDQPSAVRVSQGSDDSQNNDGPNDASGGSKRAAAVGVLFGLTYLTKATGLLLLGGFVVDRLISFWRGRAVGAGGFGGFQFAAVRNVAIVLIAAGVVAAPLLVRNVQRYGSPFFNVNSHLLFLDEFVDPVPLVEEHTLGEVAREYFATHTLGDMLRRGVAGLGWETFILCRSLGPTPLGESRALFGALWLIFALVGMIGQSGARLIVIWTALLLVMFGWYVPIAAGERFVLPLLIPLLAYASAGVVRMTTFVAANSREDNRRVAAIVFAAAIVWSLACCLATSWAGMPVVRT